MVRIDRFIEIVERGADHEDGEGFNVVHNSIEIYEWQDWDQIVHNLGLMTTNAKINMQRSEVAQKDLEALRSKRDASFKKMKEERERDLAKRKESAGGKATIKTKEKEEKEEVKEAS